MKTSFAFSRRGPDRVMEEIVTVLANRQTFEFKALFAVVYENLKQRNAAGGGEEMLRLRAYEKLQSLVQAGVAKKAGKEYKGVAAAVKTFLETAAAQSGAAASTIAAAAANGPDGIPVAPAKSAVVPPPPVPVATVSGRATSGTTTRAKPAARAKTTRAPAQG